MQISEIDCSNKKRGGVTSQASAPPPTGWPARGLGDEEGTHRGGWEGRWEAQWAVGSNWLQLGPSVSYQGWQGRSGGAGPRPVPRLLFGAPRPPPPPPCGAPFLRPAPGPRCPAKPVSYHLHPLPTPITGMVISPVHVELAPRRRESASPSGRRWGTRLSVAGEVVPGHGVGIIGVEFVVEPCTRQHRLNVCIFLAANHMGTASGR